MGLIIGGGLLLIPGVGAGALTIRLKHVWNRAGVGRAEQLVRASMFYVCANALLVFMGLGALAIVSALIFGGIDGELLFLALLYPQFSLAPSVLALAFTLTLLWKELKN